MALDVMRSCEECNWIYKPSHGSGGFGVRAVGIEEIEEIKKKRDVGKKTTLAVLQRAVTSLLVDNPGRKFDLRVYVAVASWKPLVAFILPDSLVCNMDRVWFFLVYIYITRLKNHLLTGTTCISAVYERYQRQVRYKNEHGTKKVLCCGGRKF